MNFYWIKYYDTKLDRTDFDIIFGFSESDVREQFRYKTDGTKIILSVEKV